MEVAQKESWKNFVSSIRVDTPSKIVWNKVRRIRGLYPNSQIREVSVNGRSYTHESNIAEQLALGFAENSNDAGFSEEQVELKNSLCSYQTIPMNTYLDELDMDFSLTELESVLGSLKVSNQISAQATIRKRTQPRNPAAGLPSNIPVLNRPQESLVANERLKKAVSPLQALKAKCAQLHPPTPKAFAHVAAPSVKNYNTTRDVGTQTGSHKRTRRGCRGGKKLQAKKRRLAKIKELLQKERHMLDDSSRSEIIELGDSNEESANETQDAFPIPSSNKETLVKISAPITFFYLFYNIIYTSNYTSKTNCYK
ncbi:hypothetical protein DMENIID0001_161400 [Sergentomyia squamirostris]